VFPQFLQVRQRTVANELSENADQNMKLILGEGAMIRSASAFTKTIVGEVLQGYRVTSIPSGFSIRSSQYPRSEVISSLGFPITNGDNIIKWISGAQVVYTYHNGVWTPSEPVIDVGEAFWINKRTDWKQTSTVWP
jgi:hypothetical protein